MAGAPLVGRAPGLAGDAVLPVEVDVRQVGGPHVGAGEVHDLQAPRRIRLDVKSHLARERVTRSMHPDRHPSHDRDVGGGGKHRALSTMDDGHAGTPTGRGGQRKCPERVIVGLGGTKI